MPVEAPLESKGVKRQQSTSIPVSMSSNWPHPVRRVQVDGQIHWRALEERSEAQQSCLDHYSANRDTQGGGSPIETYNSETLVMKLGVVRVLHLEGQELASRASMEYDVSTKVVSRTENMYGM